MAKGYFLYIRVSTVRQGQTGTSLAEQREAIQRYAKRWDLNIVQEFEEKETAAKSGRPVFRKMLKDLREQKASGVIIHKIDRSARNLRDWAELGEAIDSGIEVHFANENLDLESRGGRLSADIQAVVAADYIRNLREEVKKGFYGRLKQGFYPMPAPIGYLDQGAAKAKEPDPVRAPLVRKAFELYGSERCSINQLVEEMYELGLRTKTGKKVSKNSMAHILHNPFYVGLIKIGLCGELYVGQHKPIVPRLLFDRAQLILQGRHPKKVRHQEFVFRRLIHCVECGTLLIAERQKGNVYYRCHTPSCSQKTVREEAVEAALALAFQKISFTEAENRYLQREISKRYEEVAAFQQSHQQALTLQLEQLRDRLSNLTDAYIDGVVDKETFVEKKNKLLGEEQTLKERLARITENPACDLQEILKILELANNAYLSYKMGIAEEKREMVQIITSNLTVKDKTILVKLNYPFQIIANREAVPYGGPQRDTRRTLSRLISRLFKYFKSRKDKDNEEETYKPVKISPGGLKLTFRRAHGVNQERLAA